MEKFKKLKKASGTAILIVLSISSLISVLALGWSDRSSKVYDIQVLRERYYEKFYLADSVLFRAIKIVKSNLRHSLPCLPKILDCKTLGINKVNGRVVVKKTRRGKKKDSLTLKTELYFCDVKFVLSCNLVRKKTGFYVENYKIG